MAPYTPVYISRSDGKLEIISTKTNKRESNEPTAAQLDDTPDAKGISDFYKKLEVGDAKEVDWRRKLGGMLMRELGGKAHLGKRAMTTHPVNGLLRSVGKNYILAALPENYRLYEHVKFTTSEITGELLKPIKNHAKGPNDRQDAYLYGHPQGRKKRYRSPGDYFPHLLWLATDESGEPDNCSCKICAPDDLQIFDTPGRVKTELEKKDEVVIKKESSPVRTSTFNSNPVVLVPKRQTPLESVQKPATRPALSPALTPTPRMAAPSLVSPSPIIPAKCYEQDQDAQCNKYLFRPGELVWFNRGNAWGLSVIVKRELTRDQRHQDRPRYLVQPLSHPFEHPSQKIIAQEDLLRPWLAWSAPSPTHQSLGAVGLTYNSIDWKAVLEERYGPGDTEVDGSIFAAKAIDDSFTLIEPLSNNTATTVTTGERFYNGIYLGGEKLWVGEPVRLRTGNGQDIMIVHHIVERLKPGSTNAALAMIHFIGDVYRFTTMNHTPGYEAPDTRHLPLRFKQDLEYRNRATIPIKRTVSYWKIVQAKARLGIAEVKGRWYESSVLLPILRGAQDFTQDLRRGEISDVGQWMNGRGDSAGAGGPKPGTRHFDRLEAFGKAVPQGTRISRGLDGLPEDNIFPMEPAPPIPVPPGIDEEQRQQIHQAVQQGVQGVQGVSDGDIAEFMDLDRMEDGYVQQYVENGGQFYER